MGAKFDPQIEAALLQMRRNDEAYYKSVAPPEAPTPEPIPTEPKVAGMLDLGATAKNTAIRLSQKLLFENPIALRTGVELTGLASEQFKQDTKLMEARRRRMESEKTPLPESGAKRYLNPANVIPELASISTDLALMGGGSILAAERLLAAGVSKGVAASLAAGSAASAGAYLESAPVYQEAKAKGKSDSQALGDFTQSLAASGGLNLPWTGLILKQLPAGTKASIYRRMFLGGVESGTEVLEEGLQHAIVEDGGLEQVMEGIYQGGDIALPAFLAGVLLAGMGGKITHQQAFQDMIDKVKGTIDPETGYGTLSYGGNSFRIYADGSVARASEVGDVALSVFSRVRNNEVFETLVADGATAIARTEDRVGATYDLTGAEVVRDSLGMVSQVNLNDGTQVPVDDIVSILDSEGKPMATAADAEFMANLEKLHSLAGLPYLARAVEVEKAAELATRDEAAGREDVELNERETQRDERRVPEATVINQDGIEIHEPLAPSTTFTVKFSPGQMSRLRPYLKAPEVPLAGARTREPLGEPQVSLDEVAQALNVQSEIEVPVEAVPRSPFGAPPSVPVTPQAPPGFTPQEAPDESIQVLTVPAQAATTTATAVTPEIQAWNAAQVEAARNRLAAIPGAQLEPTEPTATTETAETAAPLSEIAQVLTSLDAKAIVVPTSNELPAATRDYMHSLGFKSAHGAQVGEQSYYVEDAIQRYAERHKVDVKTAATAVWAHEKGVHFGLKSLLKPEERTKLLATVFTTIKARGNNAILKKTPELASYLKLHAEGKISDFKLAEEYLAYVATQLSLKGKLLKRDEAAWNRFVEAIRKALERLGVVGIDVERVARELVSGVQKGTQGRLETGTLGEADFSPEARFDSLNVPTIQYKGQEFEDSKDISPSERRLLRLMDGYILRGGSLEEVIKRFRDAPRGLIYTSSDPKSINAALDRLAPYLTPGPKRIDRLKSIFRRLGSNVVFTYDNQAMLDAGFPEDTRAGYDIGTDTTYITYTGLKNYASAHDISIENAALSLWVHESGVHREVANLDDSTRKRKFDYVRSHVSRNYEDIIEQYPQLNMYITDGLDILLEEYIAVVADRLQREGMLKLVDIDSVSSSLGEDAARALVKRAKSKVAAREDMSDVIMFSPEIEESTGISKTDATTWTKVKDWIKGFFAKRGVTVDDPSQIAYEFAAGYRKEIDLSPEVYHGGRPFKPVSAVKLPDGSTVQIPNNYYLSKNPEIAKQLEQSRPYRKSEGDSVKKSFDTHAPFVPEEDRMALVQSYQDVGSEAQNEPNIWMAKYLQEKGIIEFRELGDGAIQLLGRPENSPAENFDGYIDAANSIYMRGVSSVRKAIVEVMTTPTTAPVLEQGKKVTKAEFERRRNASYHRAIIERDLVKAAQLLKWKGGERGAEEISNLVYALAEGWGIANNAAPDEWYEKFITGIQAFNRDEIRKGPKENLEASRLKFTALVKVKELPARFKKPALIKFINQLPRTDKLIIAQYVDIDFPDHLDLTKSMDLFMSAWMITSGDGTYGRDGLEFVLSDILTHAFKDYTIGEINYQTSYAVNKFARHWVFEVKLQGHTLERPDHFTRSNIGWSRIAELHAQIPEERRAWLTKLKVDYESAQDDYERIFNSMPRLAEATPELTQAMDKLDAYVSIITVLSDAEKLFMHNSSLPQGFVLEEVQSDQIQQESQVERRMKPLRDNIKLYNDRIRNDSKALNLAAEVNSLKGGSRINAHDLAVDALFDYLENTNPGISTVDLNRMYNVALNGIAELNRLLSELEAEKQNLRSLFQVGMEVESASYANRQLKEGLSAIAEKRIDHDTIYLPAGAVYSNRGIGGNGSEFYDTTVRSALTKLVRKLDPLSSIEMVTFQSSEGNKQLTKISLSNPDGFWRKIREEQIFAQEKERDSMRQVFGETVIRDLKATLKFYRGSDIHTGLHEFGHVWRRALPINILRDASVWSGAKVRRFGKLEPATRRNIAHASAEDILWDTEAEEKFANAFERWALVQPGRKANTQELEEVFQALRGYLTTIYNALGDDERGKMSWQMIDTMEQMITPSSEKAKEFDADAKRGHDVRFGNVSLKHLHTTEEAVHIAEVMGFEKPPSISEAELTKRAIEDLQEPTWEEDLEERARDQRMLPQDITAMRIRAVEAQEELVEKLRRAKDTKGLRIILAREIKKHRVLVKALSEGTYTAGRSLRAVRTDVDGAGLVKALGTMNRELTEREMIQLFQAMQSPTPAAYANLIFKLRKKPPTVFDAFMQVWYAGLLSAPSTWKLNFMSTAVWSTFWQPTHRVIAGTADLAIGAVTGKRNVYAGEVFKMMAGFSHGLPRGLHIAGQIMKSGIPAATVTIAGKTIPLAQAEIDVHQRHIDAIADFRIPGADKNRQLHNLQKSLLIANDVVSIPTRIMHATDAIFKTMAYEAELRSAAYRKWMQGGKQGSYEKFLQKYIVTEEAQERAADYARYSTFMDKPGQLTSALLVARQIAPALSLAVPFVNTLVNLNKRAAEMLPLVGIGVELALRKNAGGGTSATGHRVADIIAKQVEGMVIAAILASTLDDDDLIADLPENPSDRAAFWASGKLPWSIRIGDRYVSFERMEPFDVPMSALALYRQWKRISPDAESEEIAAEKLSIVGSLFAQMVDTNYFRNFTDYYKARTDKQMLRVFQRQVEGVVTPYVGFTRWLAKNLIDKNERGEQVSFELDQTITNMLWPNLKSVLGADFDLTKHPRLDVWGEQIVLNERTWWSFWLPANVSTVTDDPVEHELVRLGYYPIMPDQTVQHNKQDVKLDDDIYRNFIVLQGARGKDLVRRRIESPGWNNVPDGRKMDIIKEILAKVRDPLRQRAVREQLLRSRQSAIPLRRPQSDLVQSQ